MKRFILCLLLLPLAALGEERILEFRSDILVIEDGWIEVTETIRVQAEGQRIRRGIYRDFPTEYRDNRLCAGAAEVVAALGERREDNEYVEAILRRKTRASSRSIPTPASARHCG